MSEVKDIEMVLKKKFSGKEVIRAGERLIDDNLSGNPKEFSKVMDVLSYWRFTHEMPLEKALEMVQGYAKSQDKNSICAKRLKRHVSIANKLRRFKGMKLKNMQDIGGCRAILSSVKKLRQVERELKKKPEFRIRDGLPKYKDYINEPKDDGYRSLHLIGKFPDVYGTSKYVEVQLRTVTQHYWATALEIVDLFTKQSLKTNQGQDVWKNFFIDMGAIFEIIDGIHLFDSLPDQEQFNKLYEAILHEKNPVKKRKVLDCCKRIVRSCKNLSISDKLIAFTGSLKIIDERLDEEPVDGYVLLQVDMKKSIVSSTLFEVHDGESAAKEYIAAEKNAAIRENLVVALVYSNAVGGVKAAYPNYFADSKVFVKYLSYIRRIYGFSNDDNSFGTGLIRKLFGIK